MLFTLFPATLITILAMTFFGSRVFAGQHTFRGKGLKPITIDHVANGTFAVDRKYLNWMAEGPPLRVGTCGKVADTHDRAAGDGVYSYYTSDGSIILEDVATETTRVLVKGEDILDVRWALADSSAPLLGGSSHLQSDGEPLKWDGFKVSADLKYILLQVDYEKVAVTATFVLKSLLNLSPTAQQWRHSSHSNFYVHTLESGETTPLRQPSYPPHTAIASFSPVNHHIAYVHANDLYIMDRPPEKRRGEDAIRVTFDGSPTTFNGVPDWVYEEEVRDSGLPLQHWADVSPGLLGRFGIVVGSRREQARVPLV